MKYLGSKNRLSKYIAPILQQYINENSITTYYEPFVGGANMIDKIDCSLRIGNDIHPQLIAMFLALQNGWNPPEHITEEEYQNVRQNKEKYPDYYVGYVGFNSTFSAKYFGGYARSFKSDGITPRDQSNEAYRNLMKQTPKIKDVKFVCSSYDQNKYCNLKNALIYCDPPYQNTTKFETGSFDYDKFWDWCRRMSKCNKVFISGYQAPDDFKCVWSKESLANLDYNRGNDRNKKLRVEKLFTYRN